MFYIQVLVGFINSLFQAVCYNSDVRDTSPPQVLERKGQQRLCKRNGAP